MLCLHPGDYDLGYSPSTGWVRLHRYANHRIPVGYFRVTRLKSVQGVAFSPYDEAGYLHVGWWSLPRVVQMIVHQPRKLGVITSITE